MCLLAQFGGATSFVLLAMLIMIIFFLMRSHRYLSRQDKSVIVHTERPQAAPRPHVGEPQDLARWEVEMYETTRDLSAQLDSKMRALGHLIRDADRAAARLEKALAAGDATGNSASAAEPTRAASGNQAEGLASSKAADRGHASPEGRAGSETPAAPDPRYEEIYTLADYGYEPAEIAQRVGTPVGEVQLILGLREKR